MQFTRFLFLFASLLSSNMVLAQDIFEFPIQPGSKLLIENAYMVPAYESYVLLDNGFQTTRQGTSEFESNCRIVMKASADVNRQIPAQKKVKIIAAGGAFDFQFSTLRRDNGSMKLVVLLDDEEISQIYCYSIGSQPPLLYTFSGAKAALATNSLYILTPKSKQ